MDYLIQVLLHFSEGAGYLGIFLMMTLESTVLPIPSELVITPAAYLAYHGQMNVFLILFFAGAGSVVGALINYFLARYLGRPFLYVLAEKRWMRFLFITPRKLEKAEHFFLKHGNISTFIGRLVLGVRHLISIPAGLAKMPLKNFIIYTFLGATLWSTVLIIGGYILAVNEVFFRQYFWQVAGGCLAILIAVILSVYSIRRRKKV